MGSCDWFENCEPGGGVCTQKYNCQDPDSEKHGCSTGCQPCDDEFNLDTLIGVPQGGRSLFPHPDLESRDASGRRLSMQSHVFTRLPMRWNGWLGACFRNEAGESTSPNVRPPRTTCSCAQHYSGSNAEDKDSRCGEYVGILVGEVETCNVYTGSGWPHSVGQGTLVCTGGAGTVRFPLSPPLGAPPDNGPLTVMLRSQRDSVRQLGSARTSYSSCTHNHAVLCWGRIFYPLGIDAHCNPEPAPNPFVDPPKMYFEKFLFGAERVAWRQWDFLRLKELTARFASTGIYADAAAIAAKNAALTWLASDIVRGTNPPGSASITQMHRIASVRWNHDPDSTFNPALDRFFTSWNTNNSLPFASLPVAGTFPNSYLRRSRFKVLNVEYVVKDASLELSLILYRSRKASGASASWTFDGRVDGVYPLIRARLTINMAVRASGLEAGAKIDGTALSLTPSDAQHPYPSVQPAGADDILYVDAQGRFLVPPQEVLVDFDLGPFSDPKWKNAVISGSGHICNRIASGMRNMVVPAVKTNQHHAEAATLWTGAIKISASSDPT